MIGQVLDVPVDPDAPTATQWLIEELAKPAYQAAKPNLFDIVAKAVQDWLGALQIGTIQGPPAFGIGIIVSLLVAAIIVAFLIFGVPRLNRRSSVAGSLFGVEDARDAAGIRRAAQSAARAGDYNTAVMEMFRAIARGLAERTIISTNPGTTARDFATRAGLAFPAISGRLAASASAFDDVRYLNRQGTLEQFDGIATLERDLAATRPVFETVAFDGRRL